MKRRSDSPEGRDPDGYDDELKGAEADLTPCSDVATRLAKMYACKALGPDATRVRRALDDFHSAAARVTVIFQRATDEIALAHQKLRDVLSLEVSIAEQTEEIPE